MKTTFLLAFCLCSLGFSGGGLFSSRAITQSELNQTELRVFNAVKNSSVTKRSKIISIDESALSCRTIGIDLFNGVTGNFEITEISKEDADSLWTGSAAGHDPGNHDRFSLRKKNGRYTGYVIFKGHDYVITSLSKGRSMLIDENLSFTCGTKTPRKNQEKIK